MNKIAASVLALLLILGSAWSASSQEMEKLTLTLEKSINLALSQNPNYLASREGVDAAQAQVRYAAAQFFPSLDAQGLQILDKKVFILEFPSLVPGGRPQKIPFDFTKTYQLTLSFTLPLYTGGRLTSGYKTAKYNLSANEEDVRLSSQETVLNVKRGFYTCLLARELVKVSEEALGLAESLLQNVKNMYEVGMASRLDLLRAEVRVSNLKPPVIQARNNLAISELSLKTLLGLDLAQPVEFVGELIYQPLEMDLQESLARALARRPELSQVHYQKKIAGEMEKIARAGRLPTLAVAGNYNYWSNYFNFKKNNWEDYYSFSLVLTIPIFNGFSTPAKIAEAQAQARQIEYAEKGLIDGIKLEVRSAILNISQAKESLLSQQKNVEEAKESVRVAELSYTEGLVTITDVAAAQVALSEAQINYLRALYDYSVSQAQLEKAMGSDWNTGE
jgi:outer membrane protein